MNIIKRAQYNHNVVTITFEDNIQVETVVGDVNSNYPPLEFTCNTNSNMDSLVGSKLLTITLVNNTQVVTDIQPPIVTLIIVGDKSAVSISAQCEDMSHLNSLSTATKFF